MEEVDLWEGFPSSHVLISAASLGGVEHLVTGGSCDQVLHRLGPAGHTESSLVPPTLTATGQWTNWSSSPDRLAIVQFFNCRAVLGECAEVGYAPGALLSRVDLATGAVTATMVPMPFIGHVPLFIDGDKTGAVYKPGLYDLRFSRFTAEGVAEISEMRLPLSYLQTGIELQMLGATATVAPGDYVFVYEGTGSGIGRRRNVARFQVP